MYRQDWLTVSQILSTDFPTLGDAIGMAEHMYEENKTEHNHDFPPNVSSHSILLNKYWFVNTSGTKKSFMWGEKTDTVQHSSDSSSSKAIGDMLSPKG